MANEHRRVSGEQKTEHAALTLASLVFCETLSASELSTDASNQLLWLCCLRTIVTNWPWFLELVSCAF